MEDPCIFVPCTAQIGPKLLQLIFFAPYLWALCRKTIAMRGYEYEYSAQVSDYFRKQNISYPGQYMVNNCNVNKMHCVKYRPIGTISGQHRVKRCNRIESYCVKKCGDTTKIKACAVSYSPITVTEDSPGVFKRRINLCRLSTES